MTTILHHVLRRATTAGAAWLGDADLHHDAFPEAILTGMQASTGASAASLQQLDTFIHHLFSLDLPKNFFVQMAVAGACICILVILGLATIATRIHQRAFWVFKTTRRSEGVYLIPNALNAFLLFEGVFAAVWLGFIIVQYKGYWLMEGAMQQHIATFNLIIWWPLWIGAFMAGWGSFYTAPGILDKGPLKSTGWGRFMPRPIILNIVCVSAPLILIISLIPLIVLSQRHLNEAFAVYQTFAADIRTAIAAAGSSTIAADPEVASQFLSRASGIWDMQVRTGYYMAIGYTIWPAWAALFLLSYVPAGGYLVYLIWCQVRRQRNMLIDLRRKYVEDEAQRDSEKRAQDSSQYASTAKAMRQVITLAEDMPAADAPPLASPLLFQPLAAAALEASQAAGGSPPVTPSTAVEGRLASVKSAGDEGSNGDEVEEESEDNFFPALKPEIHKRAAPKTLRSVGGSPYARYTYLRRCFINLTILYVAIVLGAALYLGVSASLAHNLHGSYIKGPQSLAHTVYAACVAAAWGAVVFGSLCVVAIMARLIDPANNPGSSTMAAAGNEAGHGGRGQTARRIASRLVSHGTPALSPRTAVVSPQERTRTLPAVPESVGATFDELMSANGQGVSLVSQSFQGGDSRPFSTLSMDQDSISPPRPAFRFGLPRRHFRGGGIVLDAGLASTVSAGGMSFGQVESMTESLAEDNIAPVSVRGRRSSQRLKRKSINATFGRGPNSASSSPEDMPYELPQRSPRFGQAGRARGSSEPTAAPSLTATKPLAPARTPLLSPEYVAIMEESEGILGADQTVNKSPPSSPQRVRSPPPPRPPRSRSRASISAPSEPPMSPLGIVGAPPALLAEDTVTPMEAPTEESDEEAMVVPGSFSVGGSIDGVSRSISMPATSALSMADAAKARSPLLSQRRTGGLRSAQSPHLPPSASLPPTPDLFSAPSDAGQVTTPPHGVDMNNATHGGWFSFGRSWLRTPKQESAALPTPKEPASELPLAVPGTVPLQLDQHDLDSMAMLASPRRPSIALPLANGATGLDSRRPSNMSGVSGESGSSVYF